MKSAYEAALERLEKQGIERPREDALSDEAREQIAEIKKRAEADLANVEIMYQNRKTAAGGFDPQAEEEYQRDRRRIEDDRDRKIENLRLGS